MEREASGGRWHRRRFLGAMGGLSAASLAPWGARQVSAAVPRTAEEAKGMPGRYPGRVIEVRHGGMIRNGKTDAQAVGEAMRAGIKLLTGADSHVDGWKSFFQPGDVVGVKVNPVGNPLANTNAEVVLETIAGLQAAGVRRRDIVVFDRYKKSFLEAGFDKILPDGVRWDGMTERYDKDQLTMRGYDPDEYVSMELVQPSHDPRDDRTRRSHLGLLVSRHVDKVVCLPVLKDHRSAGVTLALKNISHGMVNNVARSHGGPHFNVCNQFIPQVVSHPILRKKVVLQILDGIKGVFQGGPFGTRPDWTWERNSLMFATDPVAMDLIGWEIVDAQRKRMGLAPVATVGRMGKDAEQEDFDMRQPQHIYLAGALGLGVFDRSRITHVEHRLGS